MATSESGANESKMLAELTARKGFKPYDRLAGRHGHYPAERVIVHDPGTGAPIWRLTVDPALNRHVYYDIPAWNANGSKMLFLSCRPGNGIWLADADGSNLVALDLPPGISGNHVHWGAEPNQLLFADGDATGTNVTALDVTTGERTPLFRVEVPGLNLCPLLGQQRRMMLEKRGEKLEIYTVNADGSDLRPVPIEGQLHRLRFTKAADNSIFYNLDNPRTSWVMAEDGSGRLKLRGDETRSGGGHPDWSPDGNAWSFYAEGKLWLMNRDGANERVLVDLQARGHGGFTRDGRYIVSDVSHKGPFADSLILVKTDGSGQIHRLCTHGASYQGRQSGHPDPEATHPSPNASPDGTKVVFNSDSLGGVCVVVVNLPEPPHTINIRPSDGRVQLNWRRPAPSAEIAGYNVYRAKESGGPYTRVNAKLVDTELYTDDRVRNNEPVYYVLSSVEHSGLESRYSHEVCTTPPWKTEWAGYVRHYYEPEAGKLTPAMREVLDWSSSNKHHVAVQSAPAVPEPSVMAAAEFPIVIPRPGRYRIWGRGAAEGASTASFTVRLEGVELGALEFPGPVWQWRMASRGTAAVEANLRRGTCTLRVESSHPGAKLDVLLVTDDPSFVPVGLGHADTTPPSVPNALEAQAAGPFDAQLSWEEVRDVDFSHYNVYSSPTPEFECDANTRIASPRRCELLDWGLQPNATYNYKVTSVDATGNESKPSEAVSVTTPAFTAAFVPVEAASGQFAPPAAQVEDSTPGHRSYVVLPTCDPGAAPVKLRLELDVTAPGRYGIWARVMSPRPGPAAPRRKLDLTISVDGGPALRWLIGVGHETWCWRPVQGLTLPGVGYFDLAQGQHSIELSSAGAEVRISTVMVTNNPLYTPRH